MTLQAAPLGAMGGSADQDAYALPEATVGNTQQTDTAQETPEIVPNNYTVIRELAWAPYHDDAVRAALANGGVINENRVRIYITLIDSFSDVAVLVDGVKLSSSVQENRIALEVELLNGSHTLQVSAKNGNAAFSDIISFSVNGDAAYPTLSLNVPSGISLGETKSFSVDCENMTEVDTVTVSLLMTKQLKVKNVTISEGVVGSYFWFGGKLQFDLRVTDSNAIQNGALVTFDVYAPAGLDSKKDVYWTTETAEITLKADSTIGQSENFVSTFDTPDISKPVTVPYSISGWSYSVTDSRYALIVKDSAGNPAVGVSVYEIVGKKDVLLGVTDNTGKLVVVFETKGLHNVYVMDDAELTSAVYSVKAYEAVGPKDGTPYMIQYVGLANNGKNITWMSNYNATIGSAQIKLATSRDMANAVTYRGVSNYALYETSLSINRVNEISLTDLTPGVVYYYQVGDGTRWSEVLSFEVKAFENEGNIAILGDLRGENTNHLDLISNAIKNSGVDYDFAIRAGAVTDDIVNYPALTMPIGGFFSTGLDIIHTASNEEYTNSIYNRIFATKNIFQSYLYGDVYVAVINKTSNTNDLSSVFAVITNEIRSNGSKWQILVVRDAVYSTVSDSADELQELITSKAERCGIDLVISGGDCNYSRTEPLRSGAVDEERGVIYLNCGSASVKNPVVNGDGFAFTSDSYNALYVSINTTDDQLTITVYDVRPDGTSAVIDQYTKELVHCDEDDHLYRYILVQSILVCDYCGHTRPISGYVGLLGIGSYYMFYDNGDFMKGWRSKGDKVYYLNENTGIALDGIQEINGYTYVFKNYELAEGAWIEENGARKLMWAGKLLENTWHTQAGVTYYFLNDGAMATGEVEISSVNDLGETVVETYVFDENGALIGKKD
jgi:hypothetical protein